MRSLFIGVSTLSGVGKINDICDNMLYDEPSCPFKNMKSNVVEIPNPLKGCSDYSIFYSTKIKSKVPMKSILITEESSFKLEVDGDTLLEAGPDFNGLESHYYEKIDYVLRKVGTLQRNSVKVIYKSAMSLYVPEGLFITKVSNSKFVLPEDFIGGIDWDPLCYVEEEGKTLSEMAPEERYLYSPRSKNIRHVIKTLKENGMW